MNAEHPVALPELQHIAERTAPRALLDAARVALASIKETRGRPNLDGAVGHALLASVVADLDDSDDRPWLARAIRAWPDRRREVGLHRGLAGLGFALAQRVDTEEHLVDIDRRLVASLPSVPPASLQSGLGGIAIYASLRSRADTGRALQRAVLDALRATATPSRGGLLWATPVAYARDRGAEVLAEPVFEVGIVHGVAGTLVGLASLAAAGHEEAGALARAGLRATWRQAAPGENRWGRISFGADGHSTREFDGRRWCVGDPGVLRAVWVTARAVGDDASAARALDALRREAALDAAGDVPAEPGFINLCCGAAIVAQSHWRSYQETGDPIFRAAHAALAAHCASLLPALENVGFVYGRCGVLAALLAPYARRDPAWDAILAVRVPPGARPA